jgi:hypothetical protein
MSALGQLTTDNIGATLVLHFDNLTVVGVLAGYTISPTQHRTTIYLAGHETGYVLPNRIDVIASVKHPCHTHH